MTEETPVKRGPGRPRKNPLIQREPQREAQETAVKSIKMRAKPNWENIDASAPDTPDRLSIPAHLIPEGMAAQWVTSTVIGQEMATHRAGFERKGWTPVHQDDFDGQFDGMFMPKGAPGEITVDGLVLMVRPKELNDKAQLANDMRARQQVARKEAAMRGGDLQGVTLDPSHPTALQSNKLNKGLERIQVPEE